MNKGTRRPPTQANFGPKADLNLARDIDLKAQSDRAAMQAAMEEAIRNDPWYNIPIDTTRIPNSCLYEIYRLEAQQAIANAVNLSAMLARGELPTTKNSRGETVPVPLNHAGQMVGMHISIGEIKSRLAVAAATAAQTDVAIAAKMTDLDGGGSQNIEQAAPRWHGWDGSRETGHAEVYRRKMAAERDEREAAQEAAIAAALAARPVVNGDGDEDEEPSNITAFDPTAR